MLEKMGLLFDTLRFFFGVWGSSRKEGQRTGKHHEIVAVELAAVFEVKTPRK